jgi:AcrR family transcriptional regulator
VARLKSEDRRNAILMSAIEVVAERGVGATIALIAKSARRCGRDYLYYFNSKEERFYCEIKLDLANAMMSDFPRRSSIRHRLQRVWNGYVDWGLRNPFQNRALRQIEMWAGLTDASRAAGSAPP